MKKTYIAPEVEIVEVMTECGMMAVSGEFETKNTPYEDSNVTDLSKGNAFDLWADDEE